MSGAPSVIRATHGYELREPFRLGQVGEVFRGWQPAVRRPVLVRHIAPDLAAQPGFAERFEAGAAIVARLEHPHILPLYDYWQDDTGAYLVARYLPRTLRDALESGPWPLDTVVRLAEQLALALDAAHAAGIVHQDLAPDLVVLDEQDNAFLAGFVLPQLQAGQPAPDMPYTAPEQRSGLPVSPATDLFRLGVLVFEALTGTAPAQTGDTLPSVRTLVPGLPSALNAVLQTATASQPDHRYADGRRFAAALRAAAVPSTQTQPLVDPLTERERDILDLMVQGRDNADIAEYLVLSASTVKWYVKQIYSKLDAHSRDEAVERARALGLSGEKPEDHAAPSVPPAEAPPASESRARVLPTFGLPFIGRERALDDLAALLSEPHHPLISLVAPGGMGKTRLAVEAARAAIPNYPDGVIFVSLAAATSAQLPEAILQALGILIAPEKPLWEQVIAYCASRRLLLLLDNFETVISAAPQVAELLAASPRTRALVTSRERLRLEGETVYTLGSMEAPPDGGGPPAMVESMELFIERARRVRYGFVVEDSSLRAIADICRLVDGMPLAIVLAASWAEVLLPTEIAAEIRASREFLAAEYSDLPERQRSVRIVFESAWERLSADEQRAFARLSVFHGGFTRSAAAEVAGATLRTLAGLVTKALIWTDESGRYALHELLRQFAAEHLVAAGEAETLQEAHSRYYLEWAARMESSICGPDLATALKAVDADWHNLRAALLWAADQNHPEWISPTWKTLWLYHERRSRFVAGRALLEEVMTALQQVPDHAERDRCIGLLMTLRAMTAFGMWELNRAPLLDVCRPLLERANEERGLAFWQMVRGTLLPMEAEEGSTSHLVEAHRLFRKLDDTWFEAYTLVTLAWQDSAAGDLVMLGRAQEALVLAQGLNDISLQAYALNAMGIISGWLNRRAECEACFIQALDLARRGGDRKRECNTLNNLGLQYSNWGRLDAAQAAMESSLALRREILPFVFIGYDDLADVMLRKGEFERARPLLDEGEARFERREQPRWTQSYLLFRVRLVFSLGQWQEVAARISEMRELAAQTDETSDLHLALAMMGYGAIACNDEATLKFSWAGLDELAKSGSTALRTIAAILHAERTRRSGDPFLAATILRESVPLVSTGVEDRLMTGWEDHFTPLHVRGLLVRALLDLGEINEARAVALIALDKAYAIKAPPFRFGALLACARVAAASSDRERAVTTARLIAGEPHAFAADRLQARALLETLGADPDAPPETDWEQAAAEWLAAID